MYVCMYVCTSMYMHVCAYRHELMGGGRWVVTGGGRWVVTGGRRWWWRSVGLYSSAEPPGNLRQIIFCGNGLCTCCQLLFAKLARAGCDCYGWWRLEGSISYQNLRATMRF